MASKLDQNTAKGITKYIKWTEESQHAEPEVPELESFQGRLAILRNAVDFARGNFEGDEHLAQEMIDQGGHLVSRGYDQIGEWMISKGTNLLKGNRRGLRMDDISHLALTGLEEMPTPSRARTIIIAALSVLGAWTAGGIVEKVSDQTVFEHSLDAAEWAYDKATE